MQAATDLLHEAYLQEHWLAVAALKASEARATTTLFLDTIQLQEVEARGILCRDILSEWLQEMHSILVLWHNAVQDILEVSPFLSFDVTGCLLAVALAVPLYRLLLRARLALRWPPLNMAHFPSAGCCNLHQAPLPCGSAVGVSRGIVAFGGALCKCAQLLVFVGACAGEGGGQGCP